LNLLSTYNTVTCNYNTLTSPCTRLLTTTLAKSSVSSPVVAWLRSQQCSLLQFFSSSCPHSLVTPSQLLIATTPSHSQLNKLSHLCLIYCPKADPIKNIISNSSFLVVCVSIAMETTCHVPLHSSGWLVKLYHNHVTIF
jgi:hypothetical protein